MGQISPRGLGATFAVSFLISNNCPSRYKMNVSDIWPNTSTTTESSDGVTDQLTNNDSLLALSIVAGLSLFMSCTIFIWMIWLNRCPGDRNRGCCVAAMLGAPRLNLVKVEPPGQQVEQPHTITELHAGLPRIIVHQEPLSESVELRNETQHRTAECASAGKSQDLPSPAESNSNMTLGSTVSEVPSETPACSVIENIEGSVAMELMDRARSSSGLGLEDISLDSSAVEVKDKAEDSSCPQVKVRVEESSGLEIKDTVQDSIDSERQDKAVHSAGSEDMDITLNSTKSSIETEGTSTDSVAEDKAGHSAGSEDMDITPKSTKSSIETEAVNGTSTDPVVQRFTSGLTDNP